MVGNPVRESIALLHKKRAARGAETAESAGKLLVIGGSQGARALNEGMLAGLPLFMQAGIKIRHQTGSMDYERVKAAYTEAGVENALVEPFIEDMAAAYAWADLVLSRSGASTLAEITAAGLPSVLVPFPQAAQDHQRHNALFMREQGAATLLEQAEFYREGAATEQLAHVVLELIQDRSSLDAMGERSFSLARPDAASRMVDALDKLLMRKK